MNYLPFLALRTNLINDLWKYYQCSRTNEIFTTLEKSFVYSQYWFLSTVMGNYWFNGISESPSDSNNLKLTMIPSWHLLVQSQQRKHQNNAWNMFNVDNKDIRMISLILFWYLYHWLWTDFKHCSNVSVVDFEQVNAG